MTHINNIIVDLKDGNASPTKINKLTYDGEPIRLMEAPESKIMEQKKTCMNLVKMNVQAFQNALGLSRSRLETNLNECT